MRYGHGVGLAAAMFAGFLAWSCAVPPPVTADGLPLKRVVVYRNGVGYFERTGHIASDKVNFKVRASEVGDFLATLAVMESGGSSVRSASFPISVDKEPEETEPTLGDDKARIARALGFQPAPGSSAENDKSAKRKKPDPHRLERVVLTLDGKEHDLQVGYVAVTPVWRPSYRLVVHKDGAELQAWGIVQNLSGEDWTNVSMSLVAGAPLAFEATLEQPITPERPKVTDTGEVIAVVPQTEVTLGQGGSAAGQPAQSTVTSAEAEADYGGEDRPEGGLDKTALKEKAAATTRMKAGNGGRPAHANGGRHRDGETGEMRPYLTPGGGGRPAPRRPPAERSDQPKPPPGPSAPRNLSALAAIAVESGVTRYDIPTPISVPDKSATMVMLLSKRIPGQLAFLYAPDPGVPASTAHPFRVARFTNGTGGTLERGPIAIFEAGAFLGQGMVDQLPLGAGSTVPFALERSLAIESDRKYTEEGARIAKIEAGELTIERDSVTRTIYKIRNGSDALAPVLVKHMRSSGSRLFQPPKGTEDNVGTASALVPMDVPARATVDLTVDERQAKTRYQNWLQPLADEAVKAYLADRRADPAVAAQLRAAWEIRERLVKAAEERQKLTEEQAELSRSSEETRRNLKVLEKNAAAADLRAKLTKRLGEVSARLDQITKRAVELDVAINEQQVRFTESVRSIKVLTALPAPG